MFCSNCGKQVDPRAVVCVNCGCAVNDWASKPDDTPDVGLNILSFFIPIVGLVLYAVHYRETPDKANSMLTWAVVSMLLGVFIYGCAMVL